MNTTKKFWKINSVNICANLVVLLLSIAGLDHYMRYDPSDAVYVSIIALLGPYPYLVGIALSISVLAFTYLKADSCSRQSFVTAGAVFTGLLAGLVFSNLLIS
ncbi:hypothetical protein [Alcaligenes sp. CHO6]|uniref:hypothetical protein n=1 Tax=Alcaligenes sp. CHO6 TaxID=3123298 RepID=UPI0030153F63